MRNFFLIRIKHFKAILIILILIAAAPVVFTVYSAINNVSNISGDRSEKDGEKTVIIDPGHGGVDGGAVGVGGVVEKGINLAISLKLRTFFEQAGFKVIMTRESDISIFDEGSDTIRKKKKTDLYNRLDIVNDNPNALYISIHQNKFEDGRYYGTQVFYSKNNPESEILAKSIQSTVKNQLQHENNREIKKADKNLFILYNAKSPAVIVECGFLSNANEAVALQTDAYQNKMAFSVFCGVMDYYSASKALKEEHGSA